MTTSRRDFLRGGVAFGAAFATLPLLSACGSDDAGAALDPSKAATDLDGVKLKVLVNQPNLGAWRIAARLFEQETGASVELTPIPYDKLTSNAIRDVQSGAGEFDVFQYWYVGLGDLVDAGALENLTDFVDERRAEIRPEDFLPSIYDPYTLIDDRRWGLPFDGDTFLLFYNQELFDRFGVQPPQTWEQYAEITRTITARGDGKVYGAAVMGQQVPIILGCTFADRLVGFGGRFLDDAGKPALTSPEAIAAAEALFAVSPDALPTPLQTGFDQAIPAFLSGRAAMMEFWTDMSVMASNPEQSRIVDTWRPIQLPVGGSNSTHGTSLNAGFGAGVSTLSKHKEAAAALVQFQASPRSQETVIGNFGTGADPIRQSTFASAEFRRTFGQAADDVQAGLTGQPLVWPNSVGAVDRLQTLVDELALGIQGKQSAREALQKAQDAWERGVRKTPASLSWPLIGALLLFSAFPFAYLLGLSLSDSTLARPLNGFSGLDNYADALASTAFKSSLWRSTLFAFGAALLQLALGTVLALLLAIRGKRLGWLGVALLLPLVTPPVMVGVAWKLLLAPVGGALPEIADTLGSSGFNPLGSSFGAFLSLLVIDTWQWTPFVTLLIYAALLGLPRELLDAARIDGASTRQLLRHVVLPLIAGTLVAVFLLRLVIAFKVFDIVYVVTSGGPGFATTLSAFDIYRTGLQDFQVGEAAAATVVFSLLVGVFVTVVSRLHRRVREVAP